jgi:hypothetical protein
VEHKVTDQPGFAFSPAAQMKRWVVMLSDNTVHTIEAHSFRCDAGCLVLVLPVGSAAAFAAGQWHRIGQEPAQ